jgi:hypothetical protein
MEPLSESLIRPVAWVHLNALRGAGVLPDHFEDLAIGPVGDDVYDISGEVLFHRVHLSRGGETEAYADIAVNPVLGHPFLAVTQGPWSSRAELGAAIARAQAMDVEFDEVRLVAYSYPKLAAQFFFCGDEVLMLELFSLAEVPPASPDRDNRRPGNFERWSLVEHHGERAEENAERFNQHIADLRPGLRVGEEQRLASTGLRVSSAAALLLPIGWGASRDLHYSTRNADHKVCYEVRGQETPVWCVGASTQMVLDFYRYQYTQDRLAVDLGLGTKAHPNGLPYGDEWKVVNALKNFTGSSLTAHENDSPYFSEFVAEINANRPLISFIPGHSRTVAGYYWTELPWSRTVHRGLLVFDPWPPNAGVITRYENFDAQTYRTTFTAHVTLVP